ncbi:hypothetical protein M1L60_09500 [Actinoplanes sp. TRM 88003]|uniref:Lipoprotein n=1 Tax=Paractinoplanes aksuensis TaxID=2939490 RepID=A0ABT1DJ17_9ACTN|nr:hypothetical protein [Actinoplanes aksuensis]MCO8270827.1 hypothetical protein [Actinoplanes aksuensis]
MVVGAAIAAAFAVTGCAPQGYNQADYGNAAEPAAENVAATADPADPSATDAPPADPEATAPPAAADAAPELSEEEVTSELTGTKVARMGKVVVDDEGFVLYRFDKDKNEPAKSNCVGDCAEVWPPSLTNDGKPTLKGVDDKLVGTVTRADGSKQLTLKGWPLYRYIGDKKPGNWKGQNVSGTWFVIRPDGAKNLTCLPKVSKPVAPPAKDSDDEAGSDSGDAGGTGSDYSY